MMRRTELSLLFVLFAFAAHAQSSLLDSAKLMVASNRTREAIPIFETLMDQDKEAPPHNYFLGLCLIREGIRIEEATTLLTKAAEAYSRTDFDPGMGEPEFCWYYLVIGHSRLRQCDKAMEHYKRFVQVYSRSDPFYPKEAMKWVELCHEPERMKQEIRLRNETATQSSGAGLKARLINTSSEEDSVLTRPVQFTTASILYGVQVGASLTPTYTTDFSGLKNIGVYRDEHGTYRYVIGNLSYRSQAERLLKDIRAAGYPDAFIVDINQPERYAEEVLTLNEHNIQQQITGKVEFRVQIGAFAETLPRELSRSYLQLNELKEYREHGLTVLTTGRFTTYEEARAHRDRLRQQGFEDAFVTAFNKRSRIPVRAAVQHLQGRYAQPRKK